jgi:hypothetical protein
MGEIFRAYKHLNETFNLNLTDVQLYVAEGAMKSSFAKQIRMPADLRSDKEKLMADWEFVATLVPRKKRISKSARAAMSKKVAATKRK